MLPHATYHKYTYTCQCWTDFTCAHSFNLCMQPAFCVNQRWQHTVDGGQQQYLSLQPAHGDHLLCWDWMTRDMAGLLFHLFGFSRLNLSLPSPLLVDTWFLFVHNSENYLSQEIFGPCLTWLVWVQFFCPGTVTIIDTLGVQDQKRMVFRMIHVKDSLLPMGNVWSAWMSLDFLGTSLGNLLLGQGGRSNTAKTLGTWEEDGPNAPDGAPQLAAFDELLGWVARMTRW